MRRALRTTTALILSLTAGAGAQAAGADRPGSGPGAPGGPRPTEAARDAGITRPGEAYLGWRAKGDPGGAPSEQRVAAAAGTVPGIDVSGWQGVVDWPAQWAAGKRFAYVKATEGTTFRSDAFSHQYTGSYRAGFIRGAYHFALPDRSSGTVQADHFLANGGGWSADGKTLPGALDMEWNPYGATCYGKTKSQMVSWISAFVERYKARTGRAPAIYTNTNWWNQCVGTDTRFAAEVPLWIARYNTSAGALPNGWSFWTFWQYTDKPIDQNSFNGSYTRLQVLARG